MEAIIYNVIRIPVNAVFNRFLVVFFLFLSLHAAAQSQLDELLDNIIKQEKFDITPLLDKYQSEVAKLQPREREVEAIKAISALEQAPDSEGIIFALQRLGDFYEDQKMPALSIRALQVAYQKAKNSDSKLQMGLTLKQIALVYQNGQMLTESLTNIYQALRIFEERKLHVKALISLYEASLINYRASNYSGAISDFTAAIDIYRNLPPDSITNDIRFFMMSGWNTVGLCYRVLKKNKEGLAALDSAKQLAIKINNRFWQGLIDGNKGEILLQMGRPEEAARLMEKDMRMSIQYEQYSSAAIAACSLADIAIDRHNLKSARRYLDTATMMFHKINFKPSSQRRLLLVTSHYYSAAGDYTKAYKSLQRYMQLKDSSVNEERLISLSQIKAQHELEKKQSEIQLLSQRNEIQREEIKNQRLLIMASTMSVLLVGGFLFYAFNNNNRLKRQNYIIQSQRKEIEAKNEELEAQSRMLQEQNLMVHTNVMELEKRVQERTRDLQLSNQELDTFLYHASHDIRRPIATLLGLERVSRLSDGDPNSKYLFECVARTASDMDNMLSKLQMAYIVNRPITDYSWISLHWMINEAARKFNEDFHRYRINFIHEQRGLVSLFLSPSLLMIIFSNLIENAVYFRKEGAEPSFIRVISSQNGDLVTVTIEDNGIGIEPQYLEKVFHLYFRGTERSKGNGIGLYLVQKAVSILQGTLELSSKYEVGTIFKITFDLTKRLS